MKRIIGFLLCVILVIGGYAQSDSGEIVTLPAVKKYNLRPEFTARVAGGFDAHYKISGGVNINGKRTAGLMLGYFDSVCTDEVGMPVSVESITANLFYRRYFHLGKRQVCAFYIDAYAGAYFVFDVGGHDPAADKYLPEPGNVGLVLGLQPGFRVRLYRNLHIFLGPSIASDCLGLHLGIGF